MKLCPRGHVKGAIRRQKVWRKRREVFVVYDIPYCQVCARAVRARTSADNVSIAVPRDVYVALAAYAKASRQTIKTAAAVLLRDGLLARQLDEPLGVVARVRGPRVPLLLGYAKGAHE